MTLNRLSGLRKRGSTHGEHRHQHEQEDQRRELGQQAEPVDLTRRHSASAVTARSPLMPSSLRLLAPRSMEPGTRRRSSADATCRRRRCRPRFRLPRGRRPPKMGDLMLWLIGASVVVVGALLAIQPLLNARIAGAAGHPIYGTLFSVPVSTLTMLVGGDAAAAAAAGPALDRRRARPGAGPVGSSAPASSLRADRHARAWGPPPR